MPHALLLSPDDQAVSAITGVLEEMSVTCERPLDGVSAAQKLNSQSFDLVLVDCENLPAAKLIFDVCRRGKNGNNPVPIAIVDGRAGLPTAFRLGAELILTKPVAKDQARTTIRTAVSRVRKNVQTDESAPATQAANAAGASSISSSISNSMTGSAMTEEHAQAAAAGAVSSQLTSFAEPAPGPLQIATPSAPLNATLSAPAVATTMSSAVDEMDATQASPTLEPQSAPSSTKTSWVKSSSSESSSFESSSPEPSPSESSSTRASLLDSKSARPFEPSDDPVLAELERTELKESERAESQSAQSQKPDSQKQDLQKQDLQKPDLQKKELPQPSVALDKTADKPAADPAAPVFSSYPQGRKKTRGSLVALLMLALAAAGFYAAWTYQPGFRTIAQPQIDRVLALIGIALPPATPSTPAKPSAQLARAKTPAPAPAQPTDPDQPQASAQDSTAQDSAVPDSVANSAGVSQTGSSKTSAATTSAAAAAPASGTSIPLVANKSETGKPSESKVAATVPSDTQKDAATASKAQLPEENSAVILSSKGAEKRLAYSVAPKYPAAARSSEAEGTVVLKAVVDGNGKVEGVRLVEGNATLATAAIQAVKQWRYRPYVRDGKVQPFQTVVIVDFQRP